MFGILTTAYLFLGGAGAGAVMLAALADLVWVREPFGSRARVSLDEAQPAERMVALGLLAGLLALVLGAGCLLLDLGRPDRLDAFLTSVVPSLIATGAYAVAALAACGAFLAAVRFAYLPTVPRGAVAAVEVAAVALALVVMLYTGLLLQDTVGVALWRTPLVPALFALSSLSCGVAVLLACARFAGPSDAEAALLVRRLVRFDLAVIALEAVCGALFAGFALASDHPAASASAASLVAGEQAVLWWAGFAACGIAAPLALEALSARMSANVARAVCAFAAVFVLVGGFCLRASVVEAGAHRALELQESPDVSALALE